MSIPLKRELCQDSVTGCVPKSLKRQVVGFAAENGVTESAAVRHILSLFFSGDFSKTAIDSTTNAQIDMASGTEIRK